MKSDITRPKLITFDGEARTGKGTIVKRTKLLLQSEGLTVKHIDGGQIFRALAVCAARQSIDFDDPQAVDFFLEHDDTTQQTVALLNQTSEMEDEAREAILYTPEVSEQCAKIGARSLSQAIADTLKRRWVATASHDEADVILFDGRALETDAISYQDDELVDYVMGLYFICDEWVGAKRYLGLATKNDEDLTPSERADIDAMMDQIKARNQRDMQREVEPLIRPNVPTVALPNAINLSDIKQPNGCYMAIIDTSADMTKKEMAAPVLELVSQIIKD